MDEFLNPEGLTVTALIWESRWDDNLTFASPTETACYPIRNITQCLLPTKLKNPVEQLLRMSNDTSMRYFLMAVLLGEVMKCGGSDYRGSHLGARQS